MLTRRASGSIQKLARIIGVWVTIVEEEVGSEECICDMLAMWFRRIVGVPLHKVLDFELYVVLESFWTGKVFAEDSSFAFGFFTNDPYQCEGGRIDSPQ